MSENNYCYLCQEPKSVVGHETQSCPNVKCKKCGIKGHVLRNCPNLNLNMNQKLQANIPALMDADVPDSKRVKTEENSEEKEDFSSLETMDFIRAIEFSDDIKRKKEIQEELIDVKSRFEQIKPKLEVNDNMLKARSSKMDQIHDLVDPMASKDMEIVNFVHDIEFSDDTKPKLEIKEEPLDVKSSFENTEPKLQVKEDMLKAKSSGMIKGCDVIDPTLPKDKEMIDFVHDIEFSDDIKPKLEIKEEPIDTNSSLDSINTKYAQDAKEDTTGNASGDALTETSRLTRFSQNEVKFQMFTKKDLFWSVKRQYPDAKIGQSLTDYKEAVAKVLAAKFELSDDVLANNVKFKLFVRMFCEAISKLMKKFSKNYFNMVNSEAHTVFFSREITVESLSVQTGQGDSDFKK